MSAHNDHTGVQESDRTVEATEPQESKNGPLKQGKRPSERSRQAARVMVGKTKPGQEETPAVDHALKKEARRRSVTEDYAAELDEIASLTHRLHQEHSASDVWSIDYPYDEKLKRKEYERTKRSLQIELLKLQLWVKESGQKILLIFEGRDAAGKGGSIKRFMEHMNHNGPTSPK